VNLLHLKTLTRACGLAVIFVFHSMIAADALAQEATSSGSAADANLDAEPLASGQLRRFGAYRSRPDGNTVTVLPDGAVLVYGFGPVADQRFGQEAQSLALRRRSEHAIPSGPYTDAAMWDPLRRGWRKLARAPECASAARYLHTATALSDGKVLIAGGLCDVAKFANDPTPHAPYSALSLWDPATRAWLPAPSLQQPRVFHTASLLPDGSVLIIGGESDPALSPALAEPVLGSVERFAAGQVTSLLPLNVARARHTATVLGDGSVLVTGGFDASGRAMAAAELWRPVTRSWQVLPAPRVARYGHTATRLDDGRVMIAGGLGRDGQLLSSVEIWDPVGQTWSAGPNLPIPLVGHGAALLASGKVLVAGGAWIASYGAPIPWAWTWDPASHAWQLAGHAAPRSEVELSSQITVVPQPDGSALVFTAPDILRWEPFARYAAGKAPLWQSRPSAARLSNDRVMLVGRLAGDSGGGRPVARIWNPADDSWTAAGNLGDHVWMRTGTIEMPSGRVIHVGIDGDRNLNCESWEASRNSWQDCGSTALQYISEWRLQPGLLPDGRAFVIANKHEVLVLDEAHGAWVPWRVEWSTEGLTYGAPIRGERPLARILDEATGRWVEINDAGARFWQTMGGGQSPNLLWDAKAGLWAYIFLDRKMGKDAYFLPDGCAISTNPLALFNPATGTAKPLIDPGLGVEESESEMLVLADGTVVVAGTAGGARDAGAGFFHRKASCAGFARQSVDDEYIAGGTVVDEPAPAAAAPAAAPQPTREPGPHRWELLLRAASERRWLLLATIGPVLGYFLLRRIGIRRVQIGPSWALRLLIYGLCLIFVVPALWSYLRFDRAMRERACAENPNACLDPTSGILKGGAPTQTGGGDSAIPCRMVGVWSSRHGSLMHRIELKDDGTYAMEPNHLGIGNPSGYTGHWAVQGENMVWRHDQGPGELDVNPIQPVSDTRFTLVEGNGSRTNFELIHAVPSTRCAP
jgi:hypothetical protein